MILTLPFPPSVNTYWRNVRGRTLLSEKGRIYRENVALWLAVQRPQLWGAALVNVAITAWLPDARRRDADNLFKAPLDAMGHAGVYDDDSQIVRLSIHKAGIDRVNPRIEIRLEAA